MVVCFTHFEQIKNQVATDSVAVTPAPPDQTMKGRLLRCHNSMALRLKLKRDLELCVGIPLEILGVHPMSMNTW
jgi:hypothetical protein